MKPGSLVMRLYCDPTVMGIIIRKPLPKDEPVWDNHKIYQYQWWEVLCGDKIILELDTHLKLV